MSIKDFIFGKNTEVSESIPQLLSKESVKDVIDAVIKKCLPNTQRIIIITTEDSVDNGTIEWVHLTNYDDRQAMGTLDSIKNKIDSYGLKDEGHIRWNKYTLT